MSFKKEIETLEEMVKTVKDDYWLYHSLVEQNFFGDFEHEKELMLKHAKQGQVVVALMEALNQYQQYEKVCK
jgi:hypothetical protein